MIKDLIGWFGGMMGDRRHYPRKVETFRAWWAANPEHMVDAIGGNVSASGTLVFIPASAAPKEVTIAMQLKDRRVPARAQVIWSTAFEQDGKTWQRLGCKFAGIGADDWDYIVRYVKGIAEPTNKLAGELDELASHPDDAFRLVPQAIQIQLVQTLVNLNRLVTPPEGATPLLKMDYGGVQTHPDGKKTYRLNVHSRINTEDEQLAFDSQFTLEENGTLKFVH